MATSLADSSLVHRSYDSIDSLRTQATRRLGASTIAIRELARVRVALVVGSRSASRGPCDLPLSCARRGQALTTMKLCVDIGALRDGPAATFQQVAVGLHQGGSGAQPEGREKKRGETHLG